MSLSEEEPISGRNVIYMKDNNYYSFNWTFVTYVVSNTVNYYDIKNMPSYISGLHNPVCNGGGKQSNFAYVGFLNGVLKAEILPRADHALEFHPLLGPTSPAARANHYSLPSQSAHTVRSKFQTRTTTLTLPSFVHKKPHFPAGSLRAYEYNFIPTKQVNLLATSRKLGEDVEKIVLFISSSSYELTNNKPKFKLKVQGDVSLNCHTKRHNPINVMPHPHET